MTTTEISDTNPSVNATTGVNFRSPSDELPKANLVSRLSTPATMNAGSLSTQSHKHDVGEAKRLALRDSTRTGASSPYFAEGLEKWEGRIEEIYTKSFLASLNRISGELDDVELQAEFETRQVPNSELDLFHVGSVFYLTVRTVLNSRSMPVRTASIRLRRIPRWTQAEVESFNARVRELTDEIDRLF